MSNKIRSYKEAYDSVPIPDNLDAVIDIAITKGERDKMYRNIKKRFIKATAAAAAIVIGFTITVNTIPTFADKISDMPVLGGLVKVLKFNKGIGTGGKITDGADVDSIGITKNDDWETIIIGVNNSAIGQSMNKYMVSYKDYPSTMTFTMYGVRGISAKDMFEELKKNELVEDVYTIMTLDDSMIRFSIQFRAAVEYKIEERKEPAQLVLMVRECEKEDNNTVYAVRSASYTGETLGIIEEYLFGNENMRILKDTKGSYAVESGYYLTKEEAEAELKKVMDKTGNQFGFFIEERRGKDKPVCKVVK